MYLLISILAAAIATAVPSFETSLNGKLLKSENVQWKTVSKTEKSLSNGGVIESTRFLAKGDWAGLEIIWDCEKFGNENFVRERLRMRSIRPGKYHFSNVDGRCRLIFPRHFIPGNASDVQEIRIGSFDKDILETYDANLAMDSRELRNLSGCHMFHPAYIKHSTPCEVKGPFLSATVGGKKVLLSYEHASQDYSFKVYKKTDNDDIDPRTADAGWKITDDDLWFISLNLENVNGGILASGSVRRGAYYDGEPLPSDAWYETAWYTFSLPETDVKEAVRLYLRDKITDNKAARRPEFYYNTWGMQRSYPGSARDNFTEARILEEIDRAASLGVETFVFDDGWQEDFGVWKASRKRIPNGLDPLISAVKAKGMKPGIWLGLLACDENAPIAREHPEWRIKNADGSVRKAEWGMCAMDITGGYYHYLLNALKALCDQGIRFFKWDGINFFNSALTGLAHGNESTPVKERTDRYNYLMPFYITSLMRELREYCPDVVVEIDLTEHERALIGLITLQEGKLFWMNNGASWYDDFSKYRTKNMRMVASEYSSILPNEVLTYAVYPFDKSPWNALRYNLCTSIQTGHGYWGNLANCSERDVRTVNFFTMNARRVQEKVAGEKVEQVGCVGSTPEIFVQKKDGYALLTAFGGSPCEVPFDLYTDCEKVLGVIGHAFSLDGDCVRLPLQLSYSDDCRAVFVIGNDGNPYNVISSTGWLKTLEIKDGKLVVEAGSQTKIVVKTPQGISTVSLGKDERIIL